MSATYTTLISVQELALLLATQANVLVLDARHDLMKPDAGRDAYLQEHIPNAFFMHMDADLSGKKTGKNGRHPLPDLSELAQKVESIGLNNQTQVVVYDENNGMMAARAWWLLRHLGHEPIAVLDGGLNAWRLAKGELSSETAVPKSVGELTMKPSLNRMVSADDIMQHLNDGTLQVVDARAPERFSGAVEPIDPVGGHIPNAINHFFMRNLNDDMTFKSAEALRAEWLATVGDTPMSSVVNQCGSGVTACHNYLAQLHAGLEGAALYAGSWSEWCSDASRPVEKTT